MTPTDIEKLKELARKQAREIVSKLHGDWEYAEGSLIGAISAALLAKDAEIERLKGELSEAVQTNVSALIESRNKLTEARIAARKSAIEECGVWLESQTSAFNCRDMVRALLKQDSGKAQP